MPTSARQVPCARQSAGPKESWRELGACSGGHIGRPYGVRRGCGGNWGPARAAIQAAPTDAPPIRFVGRGAHTPPNQAAGIAGLASIAAAAGPLVGAGFMPARAAPPGATGPRSSRPGHGGMWACRPTRFRGGCGGKRNPVRADIKSAPTAFGGDAAGIEGLFGRIYNPPLQTYLLPFPVVGAHFICARTALPRCMHPRPTHTP